MGCEADPEERHPTRITVGGGTTEPRTEKRATAAQLGRVSMPDRHWSELDTHECSEKEERVTNFSSLNMRKGGKELDPLPLSHRGAPAATAGVGPIVERLVARQRRYVAHTHDEFVISTNDVDVVRERIRLDRRRFDIGSGEITIYNPGEVQTSRAETRGDAAWECFSIHVNPTIVQELMGFDGIEIVTPVLVDASLASEIRRIGMTSDPQLAAEATQRVIGEILGRVSGPKSRSQSLMGPTPVNLRPVLVRMRDDLASPLSVSECASEMGLTPDQFLRSFVKYVGVPPYAWHLHLRLLEGHRRLRLGDSPAQVAAELGFADQAHFHRHFVAAYAHTPGQVRARHRM